MYTDWFWNEDKGFHHTDKKKYDEHELLSKCI